MNSGAALKPIEGKMAPRVRHGRFRWLICLLLFLITVSNYVDRQTISIVAPAIGSEFHFTNAEFAAIFNAFLVAYTVGQLFSGGFIDRVGARVGFTLTATLWSLMSILTSLARGVWSFGSCRFLLGAAESGNFPGGVKVVAEWFPAHERSTAVGIFTSGASVGAILTPPLVAYLTVHFGWKLAFILVGLPGLCWVFAWRKLYGPAATHPNVSEAERVYILADGIERPGGDPKPGPPWWLLLRQRAVWGVFLGRFVEEPASWFYFSWLPIYLERFRSLSLMNIGFLLILPFLTLDIGYVGGGWVASRLIESGWSLDRARKTVMVLSAICMMSSIPAVSANTNVGFTVLISLATFGHGCWGANIFTMPADIVPHRWVGSVYGFTAFGGGVGSIIFMQITGKLADLQGSFHLPFVIAGILPALAAVMVLTVTGEIRQMDFQHVVV